MLIPLLAMVALTYGVLVHTFVGRMRAVRAGAVRLSYFRVMQGEAPDAVLAGTRHFANLFEMPVLFYAVAVLVLALDIETPALIALAWTFVALRVIHTFIHLTYNNVRHRLAAFAAGNICVLAMWILVAVRLL